MLRTDRRSNSGRIVAAIDIGTAKVACLIAYAEANGGFFLAGLGQQQSAGIKSGMVTDADAAERAVRGAVTQAERMAGLRIDRACVAIACGRIKSTRFVARAPTEGAIVFQTDLDRVLGGGEAYLERNGRTIVHVAQVDWQLDGARGIRDPRGMAGRELAAELSAVTADEGPVRNLVTVTERCHIGVEELIAAPVASAFATTSLEERRIGTLVIDIGAGTTSLAWFVDGRLEMVEAIPVGGNHITYDIARALVTSVAEAERIKTLYGTLVKAASDETEQISYPMIGGDEPVLFQTTRARVREIVAPRVGALFDLIAERLEGKASRLASGGVVLTGGTSELVGLEGAWTKRFGSVARIGRPLPIGRLPGSMCSPALSTLLGLVQASGMSGSEFKGAGVLSEGDGYLGRVQQWFRESF